MTYEDVLYEAEGGIARITINRPSVRNAVRPRTYEELTHAMSCAADDPTVGVVVLSGAGDKAFCPAAMFATNPDACLRSDAPHMRRLFALSTVMRSMDKPIIAKVRGFCVGGGNEINLFCDLTVASEDSKFGQTGPRVGSIPIWGACQLLARFVGERKAREMVYLCRQYTAREALEMGLINQVCPAEDLDRVVDEMCSEILDKSPQHPYREVVPQRRVRSRLLCGIFSERRAPRVDYGNEENMEGITAFLEAQAGLPSLPEAVMTDGAAAGPNRFAGKVALITGGARGIGFAAAQTMAAEGARLALADINGDAAADAAARLPNATVGLQCDVANEGAVRRLVEETEARLGPRRRVRQQRGRPRRQALPRIRPRRTGIAC